MSVGGTMPRDETTRTAWRDIYRNLAQEIDTGRLAPGADLPTISELAHETGLTPHGARRVFDQLRTDGRIQSWQGKGARVAMQPLRIQISYVRPTFHELVDKAGRRSSSWLLSAKPKRLNGAQAQRLNRQVGEPVTVTETLRKVDERPIALSVDYFPTDRFQDMPSLLRQRGSISWALAEHGIKTYRRDATWFEARLPTAHEALMLDIPRTQPVYATVGANIDARGDYVQLSTGVLRADCIRFEH